jgi:hypothetical protein
MELQTTNSNIVSELPRCQKHIRNGRCRILVAEGFAGLMEKVAAIFAAMVFEVR